MCYDRVGCFSNASPFFSHQRPLNLLPQSPDSVHTKFRLFTRESRTHYTALDARHPDHFSSLWPNYKGSRPTKIICHGFLDNVDINDWMNVMKDELLTNSDFNVIIVDWSGGNFAPYTQATGNTRLVGAQIWDLIKTIMDATKQPAADFHIIGHSLGAHIAGYAGERTPGLGRITGMDPAGPYFEDTDPAVRLDITDAVFVDNIHSDAKPILQLGLGMKQAIGHADYYPNMGYDQPGCENGPVTQVLENGIVGGSQEYVACNHLRSWKFFTESINSQCPFMAYPCNKEDDFADGTCQHCTPSTCGRMGFYANQTVPTTPTKYFLTTGDHAPFCQYHVQLIVHLTSHHTAERGTMKVMLYGDKGSSGWMTLNEDPKEFHPGDVHRFTIGLTSDIGHVKSVEFGWHHMSDVTNPFKWNVLGLRHPTLKLDQLDVNQLETGSQKKLCVGQGQIKEVETDDTLTFHSVCPE